MTEAVLTPTQLNRALLARQGLLTPLDSPLPEVVEAIGAMQAQYWPALPVGLWSRTRGFSAADLYRELEARRLVVGTLLRGTLHLVSAREHPAYARTSHDAGINDAEPADDGAASGLDPLRTALLDHVRSEARTAAEILAFIEAWVEQHPESFDDAELARQRASRWRPLRAWSGMVRAPVDGRWSSRAPLRHRAGPSDPSAWPGGAGALRAVILRHLTAFGPAAAGDVAQWIGWRTPPVRAELRSLGDELVRFEDEAGRELFDHPRAPRPDPDTPAPIRFLPAFDSVLLAYASSHRARILPSAHRDRVYVRANLQWLPTLLIEGLVAGTWSMVLRRREVSLTIRGFSGLAARVRRAVEAEADRLMHFAGPAASAHRLRIEQ